jgi:hypothetical protein
MKPKSLPILEMCIDSGITLGCNRAEKYGKYDNPEQLKEEIHNCIMHELYEYFTFDQPEDLH